MKHPSSNYSEQGFVKGRIRSLRYALRGMWILISTEHSIMVQIGVAVLTCALGWYYQISAEQWLFQITAIGMVLVAESLNTAIEKICDYVHPDFDKNIGRIKDISAGAVTFSVIVAIAIGLVIYVPIWVE